MPPGVGYRGVRLLVGATGQTRWVRAMRPENKAEDGLRRLADGPDLDGDGVRELVAVSIFKGRNPPVPGPGDWSNQGRVYVDALSGKDGHPLWFWSREIPPELYCHTWPLRWWGRGPDGWPLLAVPLGGRTPENMELNLSPSYLHRPVVHVLEASTGREIQTAEGFQRPEVADLDGDGVDDLWGEADGQLRAFRGEPPEAWRTIGVFVAAHDFPHFRPGSDLDGDGIGDLLPSLLETPDERWHHPTGSRTAVARSGRDGRLLWKTQVDSAWRWLERDRGDKFDFSTFPLPAGDFDGDGAPDVLVKRIVWVGNEGRVKRPASLPLQAISGRTGRLLWSEVRLPLGFAARGYSRIHWQSLPEPCLIEPNGPPDIVVRHCSPFIKAGAPPVAQPNGQDRLARLSGRDGHVVWDVPLGSPADPTSAVSSPYTLPFRFGDLDGDGFLDVVVIIPPSPQDRRDLVALEAISLRTGVPIWTHRLDADSTSNYYPELAVGDLDGDRRAEVVVSDRATDATRSEWLLKALDGRDGQVLWTWRPPPMSEREGGRSFCLVDGQGDGHRAIGVIQTLPGARARLVSLDRRGRETAQKEWPRTNPGAWDLKPADMDGDGRDELLIPSVDGLHVLGADLKERWSRPQPNLLQEFAFVPASGGRPGSVILSSALGLDGKDGCACWAGRTRYWGPYRPQLVDPGGASRLPLWAGRGLDVTVGQSVLPATSSGGIAPPRGTFVQPGLARDDPRWTRALPWTEPVLQVFGSTATLAAVGLALANAVLPLAILRLAARRRPWSMRLLMALPVAVAVPLTVFQTIEPFVPAQIASRPVSSKIIFAVATLAGAPIVTYAAVALASLVRLRWKPLALLAGLSLAAAAIIAAAWLWADSRAMPTIERYDRLNWYLAVLPGSYAVGVFIMIGWILRSIHRVIWKRGRHAPAPVDVA
jgi:hypothetical protein